MNIILTIIGIINWIGIIFGVRLMLQLNWIGLLIFVISMLCLICVVSIVIAKEDALWGNSKGYKSIKNKKEE